jgi:hypothetical protein
MAGEKEEMPFGFFGGWAERNDEHHYWSVAYFIPPDAPNGSVSLGVVGFDPEYLRNTFFPAVLADVLASKSSALRADANPPAMMVRPLKSSTPWVTSAGWDGGKAEMDRPLGDIFQGMVVGIKYPGTTIDEIGAKFLRYNYFVLAALSMVMVGGVFLTYRNISREMKLARLKSDFVANVSHELRTPLALIRLYAETLELGRLTAQEKYQEYFRIIREESERLTALINNILDFSRIEAGRKEYEFKETNLAELVRSTLDSYRFQIEQNGFAFEEHISGDIPPVNVDREASARSLLNLVNNALKYSKDQKYIGAACTGRQHQSGGQDHELESRPLNGQDFENSTASDPLVHNTKARDLGCHCTPHCRHGATSPWKGPGKGKMRSIKSIRLTSEPPHDRQDAGCFRSSAKESHGNKNLIVEDEPNMVAGPG